MLMDPGMIGTRFRIIYYSSFLLSPSETMHRGSLDDNEGPTVDHQPSHLNYDRNKEQLIISLISRSVEHRNDIFLEDAKPSYIDARIVGTDEIRNEMTIINDGFLFGKIESPMICNNYTVPLMIGNDYVHVRD